MTDKKKLDEAASLTINTQEGDMNGCLTINAADEAELVQIIKRAGLDKTADRANGSATLTIGSPDGKLSTSISSTNLRSLMTLLHVTDEPEAPVEVGQDVGVEALPMESAEANDYGSELSSRKGEVYAGSTSRPGTARAETIPVPAKSGDNPLAEMGIKSFKEYLGEFTEHQFPRKGDLRPVLYSKYRGEEYSGWGVEQLQDTGYGSSWDMPDWFHDAPELAGPFADAREAQEAIDAYWAKQGQESIDEAQQTGKYKTTLSLNFGTDGEADYSELDVTFTYTVHWGTPETGRGYMADPYKYDPGSPSEIEDIAIVAIDGMSPFNLDKGSLDTVLDALNSGKYDDDILADAAHQDEARRPDESLEEAPNSDWQARERRFGEPMVLLPAEHNVTFDNLDQSYFKPGSYVYVVGKQNGKGNYTPRYCISAGRLGYEDGQEVTVVHDQNRSITPGRVMYQFSYGDWDNDRETLAQSLEAAGVSRHRKVPVKVFK